MDTALIVHRLQFAFTITFHYIFPQLTMGLAPLIVIFKTLALWKDDARYDRAARFWAKIFGINFVIGVITGIPMEFQFGTNWAQFSRFAGGVIGQTLAMEGMFAFFLESTFLGLFLYGEKRLGRIGHWFSAVAVFLGSWLSGYFIVATDAWMQHPVGYTMGPDGQFLLNSFWGLLLNPWALAQYAHTMSGAAVTGAFVMAAVGAFYLLNRRCEVQARLYLRVGVTAAVIFSFLQLFPTGDMQGRLIARYQPATLAAMEAQFQTEQGAGLVIIGQPNVPEQRLDNRIELPRMLSFLSYQNWAAEVKGLNDIPQDQWPDNIPLLYYSYHIMVGLGTLFIAVSVSAGLLLWRKRLFSTRWMLWTLMLTFPFPYIANTAGWMTAEIGRQPWLIHGLLRTAHGASEHVSAGNGVFTLLGFMGMYFVVGVFFLFMIWREIEHGPGEEVVGVREPLDIPKVLEERAVVTR